MNKHVVLLLISVCLVLSGCGDRKDTSSSGAGTDTELSRAENILTTESGGLVYVVYDETVNVGDVVRFKYAVRNAAEENQSGTLHWDDNSSSRVRGNGLLRHVYRAPGTYKIAIQTDGSEKVVVGAILVIDNEAGFVDGDQCRISSVVLFPGEGEISQNTMLRAIVDFEVNDISLSPLFSPIALRGVLTYKGFDNSRGFVDVFGLFHSHSEISRKAIDKGQGVVLFDLKELDTRVVNISIAAIVIDISRNGSAAGPTGACEYSERLKIKVNM